MHRTNVAFASHLLRSSRLVSFSVAGLALAGLLGCAPQAAKAQQPVGVQSIVTVRTAGGQVDWSPSEGLIAYDAEDEKGFYQLHVMSPDGSLDRCLTCNHPGLPAKGHRGGPTWHPKGRFIVFLVEKATHPGLSYQSLPGFGQFCDLWAITSDGREVFQLTNLPATRGNGVLMPHFSADGSALSWSQMKTEANLFDPSQRQAAGYWTLRTARFEDTVNGPRLSQLQIFEPVANSFYENDGFAPDGAHLLFTGSPGVSIWTQDVYTLSLAGGNIASRLTALQYNEHAVFSPDGSRILWMTNLGNGAGGGTDWWIMNADGSNKRRLTYFNQRGHAEYRGKVWATDASFSPDGRSFVGYIQHNLLTQKGESVVVTLRDE